VAFPGPYGEYRSWLQSGRPMPAAKKKTELRSEEPVTPALSPRELSKEIERVRKLIGQVEVEISEAEHHLKEIELDLSKLPAGKDVLSLTLEHQAVSEQLEGKMAVWEEQSRRLEELVAMQGIAS
jgi:hypothetical protein